MMKAVFFDLDGTMLPMKQDDFVRVYFTELCKRFCPVLKLDDKTLIKSVWKATDAMYKNDGAKPNIEVFWKRFTKLAGSHVLNYVRDFDDFYTNEFNECKSVCGYNPAVPEGMKVLSKKGYTLVAATNPLFPAVAIENRLGWAGVDKRDFALVTTYENSSFCKPSKGYFREIASQLGLELEECMMVGNDVDEDMLPAKELGMDTFLVTDHLINRGESDYSGFKSGSYKEFLNFARIMPDVK